MDFRVTEDQAALQEGIRNFCEGRVSIDQLRELEGPGFAADLWSELAEMGVFALRLDESAGGVGLGTADAVLVFEELGKALVPGPLAWTHLAAGLVDGAADGTPPLDDQGLLQRWVETMTAEFRALRSAAAQGRATLLDTYGATNPAEFFAVATECFFETSDQLQRRHGALYGLLRDYYHQDPAARS